SSTFGALLGGTIRGGHQGVDSEAFSLITPPNFGSGGGSCFPSMVVVALGEPNSPVTCCAMQKEGRSARTTPQSAIAITCLTAVIRGLPFRLQFCRRKFAGHDSAPLRSAGAVTITSR